MRPGNAAAVYATNGEAGGIAGNNNKDALIENVQVRAAVTAANGTAGGVTATNFGTIGQGSGPENNSSVSGCTITGTSESIGAVAAYNGKHATIRNVKLAANANVRFSTPAVTIGGLAGMNEGTVTGCQVENGALALDDGLRAGTNTVTLGGAVGRTTADGTVSSTDVLLNLTQNLDKYTNLGGVAGQNDGTLDQCTYSGTMGGNADTDGLVSVGARSTSSTVGGIAGLNNSKTPAVRSNTSNCRSAVSATSPRPRPQTKSSPVPAMWAALRAATMPKSSTAMSPPSAAAARAASSRRVTALWAVSLAPTTALSRAAAAKRRWSATTQKKQPLYTG